MLRKLLKLPSKTLSRLSVIRHMVSLKIDSLRHGRDLEIKQDYTAAVSGGDILLFCTLRNERVRIPWFLDYYRRLGVRHFFFVDNGSTDGFQDYVRGMPDVSVWYTEASYKSSAFGMHWLNYLLAKYGVDHWCVVCDPDEFLVYPHIDTRNLAELASLLDSRGRSSLFALMIDMYSEFIDSGEYFAGDIPWSVCPYFDRNGYSSSDKSYWHNLHAVGGVRQRLFYSPGEGNPPALNKLPFVRWKRHYCYVSSTHNLAPRRPNVAYRDSDITGCLLHFKFISRVAEKSQEEMQRQQHYDNSSEYRKYNDAVSARKKMYCEGVSARYEGWEQLVALRLMSPGSWWS